MIPIFHNTLLATPKIKFYSGAFILLGSIPISDFTVWAFAHLGPTGVLGPKIKFDFGGFYPSLGSRTQIDLGLLPIFGATNSNFTPGIFHFWGPPNQNE
jgi:hypothetical protein